MKILVQNICSKNSNIEVVEEVVPFEDITPPFDVDPSHEVVGSETQRDMVDDQEVADIPLEEQNNHEGHNGVQPQDKNKTTDKPEIKCSVCGKELASVANLKQHVAVYHGNDSHQCDFCNRFLQLPKSLNNMECVTQDMNVRNVERNTILLTL